MHILDTLYCNSWQLGRRRAGQLRLDLLRYWWDFIVYVSTTDKQAIFNKGSLFYIVTVTKTFQICITQWDLLLIGMMK
jgi:hypothetical protein